MFEFGIALSIPGLLGLYIGAESNRQTKQFPNQESLLPSSNTTTSPAPPTNQTIFNSETSRRKFAYLAIISSLVPPPESLQYAIHKELTEAVYTRWINDDPITAITHALESKASPFYASLSEWGRIAPENACRWLIKNRWKLDQGNAVHYLNQGLMEYGNLSEAMSAASRASINTDLRRSILSGLAVRTAHLDKPRESLNEMLGASRLSKKDKTNIIRAYTISHLSAFKRIEVLDIIENLPITHLEMAPIYKSALISERQNHSFLIQICKRIETLPSNRAYDEVRKLSAQYLYNMENVSKR